MATIVRFGTRGRMPLPLLRRSHKGLVFTSPGFTAPARRCRLRQASITPHARKLVQRLGCTRKAPCVHRHCFESLQHASHLIGHWIPLDDHRGES